MEKLTFGFLVILKEYSPISCNCRDTEELRESIADVEPLIAKIPIAIDKMVNDDRNLLDRTESNAMRIPSII